MGDTLVVRDEDGAEFGRVQRRLPIARVPTRRGIMLYSEAFAALGDHVRAVEEAFRTRDWEGWAACFIEEGVFVPPNQPSVHGRSALVEYGNGLPALSQRR